MQRFSRRTAAVACAVFTVLTTLVSFCCADDNNLVRVTGSKYPFFTITDLARWYMQDRPKAKIIVNATDQYSYLQALLEQETDAIVTFGKMDEDAKSEAAEHGVQLVEYVIGWGAVAVVTDPKNSIDELTVEQVRKIFLGEYNNWKELGGPDLPIVTMSRDEDVSGTERFFRDSVLGGTPSMQETVRTTDHDIARTVWRRQGSIADARYTEAVRGRIRGMVKLLSIKEDEHSDAVMPSPETIRNQSYPMSAPLVLYYDARFTTPELRKFADYCIRRGLGPRYAGGADMNK